MGGFVKNSKGVKKLDESIRELFLKEYLIDLKRVVSQTN